MAHIPWTLMIFSGLVAYMAYTMFSLYSMFNPPKCSGSVGVCVKSYLTKDPKLVSFNCFHLKKSLFQKRHELICGQLEIMVSTRETASALDLTSVGIYKIFSTSDTFHRDTSVSIPLSTRKNGSLYIHGFLYLEGMKSASSFLSHSSLLITKYAYPQASVINLLSSQPGNNITQSTMGKVHTHWRSKLTVSVMADLVDIDRRAIPGEIFRYFRITGDSRYYYPILFLDEISFRIADLQPVNLSSRQMPLSITYAPISLGKLRVWKNFADSFKMLHSLGFTEKDTDEIKGIFSDTNFYLLLLTFSVAAFHLLFDVLAFKNDIQYWKKRQSMEGLSSGGVVWRCISTIIVFFYLLDEDTSLLVTIPAGISSLIEVWKVKKVYKLKITHTGGYCFKLEFGALTAREKETEEYNSQAMTYLSYLMCPLVLIGASYSLIYVPHKSWYSWSLQSLVNGSVYAFGFLFMLPQLFLNYKLKSVSHLPWRAFMYKAFNTFIDDIFAFIIHMPTAHRLACFRDDVVFLIYLYQRWLYPVDWTRVNEFGVSFENSDMNSAGKLVQQETKKKK